MSIMGTVFLSYRRGLQKKLLPLGGTLKQHYVLRQLIKREYLLPSEIAEELYCDRPTASVIIKNLLKQGWITKYKDPANGKYFRITITEKGREQAEKACGVIHPEYDPLSVLDAEERKQFIVLLKKIKKGQPD